MIPLIPRAEKEIAKAFAEYDKAVEAMDDDIDVPETYDPEQEFLEKANAIIRRLAFDSIIAGFRALQKEINEMVKEAKETRE